jgi:hypothetical protein
MTPDYSQLDIETWHDRVTLAGLHPAEHKLADLATSDARVNIGLPELAATAGVSAMTARQAVAELEAAGLLIRRCCALCRNPNGFELIGGRP